LALSATAPKVSLLPGLRILMLSNDQSMQQSATGEAEGTDAAGGDEILATLRSSLDALPAERRGNEWLRASVLVNCLFRHAAKDTFRQLEELRKYSEASEFDEFVQKLFAVLDPFSLSPHGYKRSMGSRDSASNWEAVAGIGNVLEECGVDWFINSGTLLGAVRDNDFISHDDDVDLAVLLPGNDVETVVRNWFLLKDAIRDRGMLVEWNSKNQTHIKVKAKFGVDIFPCWIIDDRIYIWPHTHGELGANELLPLEQRSMGPATVKVPAKSARVLELNYGPDWQTRNPAWRFDWRAAWKKFRDFRLAHRKAKKQQVLP
jgi:hypothetical protein